MTQLNAKQKEAVRYVDGPCLVLAGAGSGKTSVITQKIAYLISECQLKARNIAALTFTNKAAREMKTRVGKLIKQPQARGLIVSTFHNLGLTIIRQHLSQFGYREGFSIFDAEDSRSLLKQLMLNTSDLDEEYLERAQRQISSWKNQFLLPEKALIQTKDPAETRIAEIYQRYCQSLLIYNAVDFDDLILQPIRVFSESPDLLSHWQRRIRYLLIDEYQDTNTSQYHLIRLLVANRAALTVVGDDDQSIYAWRGARPENLSILQRDFSNLKVIKLEQNYRSTQRILGAANHLIGQNPHEFTKVLWSDKGYGELIRLIRTNTDEAEAERVATELVTQRLQRRARYRDFAVLYRSNHQARLLELKLQQYQVPYAISGGTSFFARREVKDVMAYLRLIVNPDDDNALLRIINTPRRQLGAGTIETLSQYAGRRQQPLFAAAQEIGLEEQLSPTVYQRLQRFTQWIQHVTRQCEQEDPVAALQEMLEDMDYSGWLNQQSSSPKVAERRMENVNFLLSSISKMLSRADKEAASERSSFGLKDAIANLLLQDLLEQQQEEDDSDRVQLMTLHAAKGLEFPHVFIIGVEEELLPHRTSIEENNIDEERRLAYVGITRAQLSLTLTVASKRKQFGEMIDSSPSRFIDELPQEMLQREGFEQHDPEQNAKKGEAALGSLLNLFD
ncbi:MAG: ATP-dependent DNA helicase Rep [Cellvibrionaceae bacterium]